MTDHKIIRTPTRAEGGLTDAERAALAEHSKLWISRALRTEPADFPALKAAIEGMYEAAGMKKPRVVLAPSPLVTAFAYGAAAAIWEKRAATLSANDTDEQRTRAEITLFDNVAGKAWRAVETVGDDKLDLELDAATWLAVRTVSHLATLDAVRVALRKDVSTSGDAHTVRRKLCTVTASTTSGAVSAATDYLTRVEATSYCSGPISSYMVLTTTGDVVHRTVLRTLAHLSTSGAVSAAAACYEIAGEDGLRHAKKWELAYQGGAYWAADEAYLTAFRDVLGLQLPEYEKYHFWEQAAIHGTLRVMHEEFCIVSDFPEILHVDEQNRPHCADGPSHRWRDGWSLYHWHGVAIPAEWVEVPGALTAEVALTCENLEQRRAACEMLGWATIIDQLGGRVIDEDGDEEIGALIEVDMPGDVRARFLRVRCGTGRQFAVGVPPDTESALAAQAWMLGVEVQDWAKPEVRT